MKPRRQILALGLTALAAPLRSLAQQPKKVWRVGFLPGGPLPPRLHQYDAFRKRMLDLGYAEGRNVEYIFRVPDRDDGAYDALAGDLVRQGVDVIVASSTAAITAAKRATGHIPVVMSPSTDPVGFGFVASLRRPGGNLTGVALMHEEITGKRLQLLREMVPTLSRVAFLWSAGGKPQLEAAAAAARQLGLRLQGVELPAADALPAAFDAAVKERAEAIMVSANALTFGQRDQIIALALRHRLPSMFVPPVNAVAGGLMSYGPNDSDYFRQAAGFVDKIFRGAKPADLPVEQPTRFELVINMKTARALGLTVPPLVLLQANRVLE